MPTPRRLFHSTNLDCDIEVSLTNDQLNHIRTVLRLKNGDMVSLFNDTNGEWQARLKGDKAIIEEKLYDPIVSKPMILAFVPIKPHLLQFVIEKSCELGVTEFRMIHSSRCNIPKINAQKFLKYAIAAIQQSGRFTMPTFHDGFLKSRTFFKEIKDDPNCQWYAAIEHLNVSGKPIEEQNNKTKGLIVGPEGGWDDEEMCLLKQNTIPLSLGKFILRAETAVIVGLDRIRDQSF